MALQSELGSIVAFEGRSELVSTQLRLLPPSSQLLVLPHVKCYLARQSPGQRFDPCDFVLQVNKALAARLDAAHTFLKGSTTGGKRLVFMNGGTAGAQALCIRAIMKHETAGDQIQALAVFDDLVWNGTEGLRRKAVPLAVKIVQPSPAFEDPVSKAMRAAEALDSQTANLQPSCELDLSTPTRQRSSSLPLYKYSDAFGDGAPFFVFGAPGTGRQSILSSPPSSPRSPDLMHHLQRQVWHEAAPLVSVLHQKSATYSPSCIGETYGPNSLLNLAESRLASPVVDCRSIHHLEDAAHGKSSLLTLRPLAGSHPLVRVRSLDRIYLASPKFRDPCVPFVDCAAEMNHVGAHGCQSEVELNAELEAHFKLPQCTEETQIITVRSRMPVVLVNPVPQSKKKKSSKQQTKAKNTYIDRGTDAEPVPHGSKPLLQPIFAHTEDLVVLFKGEPEDKILCSIIDRFKTGSQVSEPPRQDEFKPRKENESPNALSTPTSEASTDRYTTVTICLSSQNDFASKSAEEYDPFAYTKPLQSFHVPSPQTPMRAIVRPPTPAQTPPPTATKANNGCKFKDLKIESDQTAVTVQNSLRSLLSMHFPSGSQGYHQFHFSLLPELEGLWRPIFHSTEANGPHKSRGRSHQILAIGSQKGVRKEYFLTIIERLERLGSTHGQMCRVDRIDFRYLLANAMQSYTSQPLAKQTCDNPFAIPYLLATLIVPHLETYLALHPEVHYLLLQYSPEHLETVLALQKLVGVDLLRVAQIVDSESKEKLPFTHVRGASISKRTDKPHTQPKKLDSCRTPASVSVSKANYLLTSTASDKDIAKFVSAVWNIPMDADRVASSLARRTEMGSACETRKSSARHAREESGASSSRLIKHQGSIYTMTKAAHPRSGSVSETLSLSTRPSFSIDSTIRGSERVRGMNGAQTDTSSMTTYDSADESDVDQEERRLMPLFLPRAKMLKPNSHKALKFLGLA
ncbi:hypothetical protein CDD82_1612 [Ophiocordyceps australis]|uniref:Uncharacterized protein n=1 Tax=Ophiocordyceps australis TaxID=1399860 RepID=A0A2C5ZU81_9HYPO|nr:hypothetical protein CDD82_1612 [Ophiocordyceps australis]